MIETENKSSSFDPVGRPDPATKEVRKRFLFEARNEGLRGAVKAMDARNEQRKEAQKRRFDREQKARIMDRFPARLSASAVRAAGSRTTTATIDGIRGILTEWFRDGEVVREEFKPI